MPIEASTDSDKVVVAMRDRFERVPRLVILLNSVSVIVGLVVCELSMFTSPSLAVSLTYRNREIDLFDLVL